MAISFVDIHCHLLPGIDDGARDWDESMAMAQLAVADGTTTIIATPHQLGNFGGNRSDTVRGLVAELQQRLDAVNVPLKILAGADVRIEPDLAEKIHCGDVLSLGDHRRHVLLELPHELYLPMEPVLDDLARRNMVGILSHPERNQGIQRDPNLLVPLVDRGCLTQVTAGSLCGSFGGECQRLAEWMLSERLVHFVATDAHGPRARRPLMLRAYQRVVELTDEETAADLCLQNPSCVAAGCEVRPGRRPSPIRGNRWWTRRTIA